MHFSDWLLTPAERGNPATRLDDRHPGGAAWSRGNLVRPLIHGATYFAELRRAVEQMVRGDRMVFVDWRGDPDELLTPEPGSEVSRVLCQAAGRGVDIRGLIWRSHLDRLQFSQAENRHLGEELDKIRAQGLLDMRVRLGGSHHQKFVVLRHPGRPELDVAFVGGIDLCHSRRDDADHAGDRQRQPMAAVYGPRPPWHDVQLAIRGPAVGDVETVFRERWEDPQPLSRNPIHVSRTGSGETTRPRAGCRRSCPTRRRPARTPCNCCAPIPTGPVDTRSPRPGSAASPAATPRRCTGLDG